MCYNCLTKERHQACNNLQKGPREQTLKKEFTQLKECSHTDVWITFSSFCLIKVIEKNALKVTYAGTLLQFQHLGSEGKRTRSSRLPVATKWVQSFPSSLPVLLRSSFQILNLIIITFSCLFSVSCLEDNCGIFYPIRSKYMYIL